MTHQETPAAEHTIEDDAVFALEQSHLTQTFETLCSMEAGLHAQMAKTDAEAEHDKRIMADEMTHNFASEGEAQETYIEYSGANRVIEGYNQLMESAVEKLGRIEILKRQPYFAKVAIRQKLGVAPKELYIGNVGISDDDYRRMVVDWRSPVAEVYYNQSTGPTSYVANGRTIKVDLVLRRQFDIEGATLHACFDTTIPIQDQMLLSSLSRQRSSKMQAITTTIQKEQNEVIRYDDVAALLVNGVAGSGKTSVMLQRIAYLLYRQRETLNPENIFIISPNPVFRAYIDAVLPDMGERNPFILTWDEFAERLTPPGRVFSHEPVGLGLLAKIEDALPGFDFQDKDFRDISSRGTKLITSQQIARAMHKFDSLPAGPRRMALVREELTERLESRLGQLADSEEVHDEIIRLGYSGQVSLFGEPAIMEEEKQARAYALRYLRLMHRQAFEAIRWDWWLRVDRIGKRLVGIEELPFLAWAYLKIRVSGLGDEEARYVMIDEVQDYSAAQLAVMARYFNRAHFLLLGDENQAIEPGTATFDQVCTTFANLRGGVEVCTLQTSYRSTASVTHLFAKLASFHEDMVIQPVQRDDEPPVIETHQAGKEYREGLRRAVREAAASEGLTALIALDDEQAQRVWDIVGDEAAQLDLARVRPGEGLPGSGIVLITLALAKGLEFDQVIIADASALAYPGDDLSRRRLYTAISRATKRVHILAEGELSALLA